MTRTEKAYAYHQQGRNCCQSVLASFTDLTGLSEEESFRIGGGFGAGAGTGELCGAISGAVMTLGLVSGADPSDPVGSKKRAMGLAREMQKRFREKFGALRCEELLKKKFAPDDTTPAAKAMGITAHCSIMVVTAAEIVEELLREQGAAVSA